MTSPGSVGGDERLRLFLALQLPDDVVASIAEWQAAAGAATARRLVPPENLHVTLAFLGSRPAGELPAILRVLGEAARDAAAPASRSSAIASARASACSCSTTDRATAARLAGAAERARRRSASTGGDRDWLPHVTVLRFRERPRLRPPLPELGTFAPSECGCLPIPSAPVRGRYEVLESFPLNR